MENEFPARVWSEEQITSLVLLERHGLMSADQICQAFHLPRKHFRAWKKRYGGWDVFHKRTALLVDGQHRRQMLLLSLFPSSVRRRRHRYSARQIGCIREMIASRLATPDQVCQMFNVRFDQLEKWDAMRPIK